MEELHHRRGRPGVDGAGPMSRHGIEYSSPADLGVDVRADLRRRPRRQHERPAGNGCSASASTAANTAPVRRPPAAGRRRRPATSRHQSTAAACICSSEANSRPRQNESRTYGIGRSTRALSRGFSARAGSTSTP